MITTVLLDFYNTLYAAREWFDLEAYRLAPAVLEVLAERGQPAPDGVLDAAARAYRAVRLEVHASGLEVSAEEGLRRTFDALGLAVPEDATEILSDLQRRAYRPGREIPGAVEAVRELAARGYVLGIVSNALCADFLRWSLEGSGIEGCFRGVFTSADVGYYKSSPRFYQAALEALGAEPAEAVHVGDSYRFDVLGARAAGLRTIWYAPSGEAPPEEGADVVLRHLSELPGAVGRLSSREETIPSEME